MGGARRGRETGAPPGARTRTQSASTPPPLLHGAEALDTGPHRRASAVQAIATRTTMACPAGRAETSTVERTSPAAPASRGGVSRQGPAHAGHTEGRARRARGLRTAYGAAAPTCRRRSRRRRWPATVRRTPQRRRRDAGRGSAAKLRLGDARAGGGQAGERGEARGECY
nr:unnamed protein product [Digitaria exilis]